MRIVPPLLCLGTPVMVEMVRPYRLLFFVAFVTSW
jgi:hypothetical protein